ncbi:uncharacterized protein LOC128430792 [Pleuronectes platessa]|uniref:uncharacterized protein LOC128430792 n=1 Tax=Pleuronectes platessa TaxID=8262 RepID=UPI00232A42E4|nr:uncharacterized protein LOC128430792 [Pleuronectes platessa]XP_053272817.1 uncharacterized protein LOC128430792 [Pleuronectes platessa]
MFRSLLLLLAVSGLQAAPIALARGLQKTSSTYQLHDGFQMGTEHDNDIRPPIPDSYRHGNELSRRFLVDLNIGLVQDNIAAIRPSLGNGFGEMDRRQRLTDEIPVDVPAQKNGGGWVRGEAPAANHVPDGFRQGTEPVHKIQAGFRQGTEPFMAIPDGFRQGTEPFMSIPDGFRQGTEPLITIPDGFRQGTEPFMSIPDGFRQGTEPLITIPDGFRQGTEPFMSIPDGFRQGTEPCITIPNGFRQGTEPVHKIQAGFRQGTKPFMAIPDGFRQGTEPFMSIPDGFRQGTEPFMSIPDGFRQGTEPFMSIPDGFRQGTEPFMSIPDGFRQGTEPFMSIPDGFRQGTEPSVSRTQTVACKGEVINGNCYEFNPTPLTFQDAQVICRALAPNAELASVPNSDLHSRLVSLVTKGGEKNPVLTWLGGTVKNQEASWVDGSEWGYSDWKPGHPNIQTDKPVCLEMFQIDESWWTAADCDLRRASICSYPITV